MMLIDSFVPSIEINKHPSTVPWSSSTYISPFRVCSCISACWSRMLPPLDLRMPAFTYLESPLLRSTRTISITYRTSIKLIWCDRSGDNYNNMEFSLQPPKAALFKDLVEGINRIATEVEVRFDSTGLSIQCTDTGHATLVETTVPAAWLDLTLKDERPTTIFGVRLSDILIVLGCRSKSQTMTMSCSGTESDKYLIAFTEGASGDLGKEFELPMYDFDCERFELPEREHDVDLELRATRVLKLVQELEAFGSDVTVDCNDDAVTFCASSITLSMKATLDVSELESYAVPEGGIKNTFATSYLVSVAGFAKLTKYLSVPDKVEIHFNEATPAEFFFKLGTGDDAPTVLGVVAPKVVDDGDE